MADLPSGAYGPPAPQGPYVPPKPLAQQAQELMFAGRTPSKEEVMGLQDFVSSMAGNSNLNVLDVLSKIKNSGLNYDFAGRLGDDYYQNKLTQQIADQRTTLGTEKYYAGDIAAMGGIDKATQWMATLLVRSGIRDINEIKEVTETKPTYGLPSDINFKRDEDGSPQIVRPEEGGQFYRVVVGPDPEGGEITQLVPVESIPQVQTGVTSQKKLINSRTGEQLKQGHDASYSYASTQIDPSENTYTFGGSFAGGNTSLNITMANGAPVFFSTPGPSSSDFPKELILPAIGIASLMFPGATLAIGNAVAGAIGATVAPAVASAIGAGVLTTVATEGDIKQGLISAATSLAAGALAPGAEQVGYGGAGDVLASPEIIGGPAGYGGAGSVLSSDELFDAATELSGLTGTDIASTVASAPELSNVVATLEDGASLVSDAAGNLSVVDDIAAAGSDMLPLATDFGAEGFASMGPRLPASEITFPPPFAGIDSGSLDFFPQQNVFSRAPAELPSDFYSTDFMGPRLPPGANVVATLDDGAMLVSDATGNLSLVDAAGVPETFDTGTMAGIMDTGAATSANTLADVVDAGLVDEITANTYLDPNRPINVLDDGAVSQTFGDGSAIEIDASGNVTVKNATDLADEAVPINREVTLDADLPPGAKSTGPIDADGVPITREVTLDADLALDGGTNGTELIDADGVPIKREVFQSDVTPANTTASSVVDNDPFGGDLPGDGAFTQKFPGGSTLTVNADGTIIATDATEGLFGDGTGGGAGAGDLGDGGGFGVRDDYGVSDAVGGGDGASGVNDPFGGDLPPGGSAPIEDRTTLYEAGKDKSLLDSLKDLGGGALEFATSNPLLTAGVLLGGASLLGGDAKEVDPEPQEPVKKTYTYGEAPTISYAGLPELFSAASTIYGPQEAYAPPTVRRQELQNVDFGPLLSGRAPGAGLRSLVKTLPTPTGIDISQLTPEQRAQLEQVIAQGGV